MKSLPILFTALSLTLFNCSSSAFETTSDASSTKTTEVKETRQLNYTTFTSDVMDEPWGVHLDQQIILQDKIVTEAELRELLISLYNNAKTFTGYLYSEHPTSVRIGVYPTEEKAKSGQGQWVGMISKDDAESTREETPQIRIDQKQLKLPTIVHKDKFGFKEEKRQEIFKRLTKIELETIGNMAQQPKLEKKLAKELNTTIEILDSIGTEGVIKGWTIPGVDEV